MGCEPIRRVRGQDQALPQVLRLRHQERRALPAHRRSARDQHTEGGGSQDLSLVEGYVHTGGS